MKTKAEEEPKSAAGPQGEDLSQEIRNLVSREAGDIVRCTRVGDRYYRCNWWESIAKEDYDNPGMKGGQLGTTYRVRKSAFMEVSREGTSLKIKERPTTRRRALLA